MKRNPLSNRQKAFWAGLGLAAGASAFLLHKRRQGEKVSAWNRRMTAADPRTALITGASSGIGEAYARRLAAQGYHLVLVARRAERMEALAEEFRQAYGVEGEVLAADLSTEEGLARVERRIVENGDLDFLVNNAGYDEFGSFVEIPIEKTLGLINCLALATVRLSRAALPGMLARCRGAIVNLSSIGAFGPKPHDSTYVASKAYVNQFSESLAIELGGSGVRVQALCPGFTLTGFHDAPQYAPYHIKERIPRWMWMAPEAVVEVSLRALGEDRQIVVPGWKNRLIVALARTGLSAFLLQILRSFFKREARQAPPAPGWSTGAVLPTPRWARSMAWTFPWASSRAARISPPRPATRWSCTWERPKRCPSRRRASRASFTSA
jgi:short-subunit dehydrogenase